MKHSVSGALFACQCLQSVNLETYVVYNTDIRNNTDFDIIFLCNILIVEHSERNIEFCIVSEVFTRKAWNNCLKNLIDFDIYLVGQ